MKICTKCLIKKELNNFHKQKSSIDWLQFKCKFCSNKRNKEYKRTIPWLVTKIYSQQRASSKIRNHKMPTYTKDELKNWVLWQDIFEELYNNWVESWYKKDLIPSVDRLDDYKWYSLDNIQLITFKENYKKSHKDMREWRNNKTNKAVIWINIKTGEKVEFYSMNEAKRQTWINNWCISNCCNWKLKTAGWYKWKFKI